MAGEPCSKSKRPLDNGGQAGTTTLLSNIETCALLCPRMRADPSDADLTKISITSLRQKLLTREIGIQVPTEIAKQHRNLSPGFNTYLATSDEDIQQQLDQLESLDHAPLAGIPISIKDCFDLTGYPTALALDFIRSDLGFSRSILPWRNEYARLVESLPGRHTSTNWPTALPAKTKILETACSQRIRHGSPVDPAAELPPVFWKAQLCVRLGPILAAQYDFPRACVGCAVFEPLWESGPGREDSIWRNRLIQLDSVSAFGRCASARRSDS